MYQGKKIIYNFKIPNSERKNKLIIAIKGSIIQCYII